MATSTEYLVRNWLDATFAWLQVVVFWHEPRVSLCVLTSLLPAFLFITYFAPRFYAIIMLALFIYNFNKFWFRHVWPEIRVPPKEEREEELRLDVDRWTYLHPHLMTISEFGHHIRNLIKLCRIYTNKMLLLRREKPIKFCSIVCSVLFCIASIANRISGLALTLTIAAVLLSAPGIYLHLLPESAKQWLKLNVGSRILGHIEQLMHREHLMEDTSQQVTSSSHISATTTTATTTTSSAIPESSVASEQKSFPLLSLSSSSSSSLLPLLSATTKTISSETISFIEHFKRMTSMYRNQTGVRNSDLIVHSEQPATQSSGATETLPDSSGSDECLAEVTPGIEATDFEPKRTNQAKETGAPVSAVCLTPEVSIEHTNVHHADGSISSTEDEQQDGGFVLL